MPRFREFCCWSFSWTDEYFLEYRTWVKLYSFTQLLEDHLFHPVVPALVRKKGHISESSNIYIYTACMGVYAYLCRNNNGISPTYFFCACYLLKQLYLYIYIYITYGQETELPIYIYVNIYIYIYILVTQILAQVFIRILSLTVTKHNWFYVCSILI